MSRTISAVLVGEESLCLQCAELLLEGGHAMPALVTRSAPMRQWAEERQIPVVKPGKGLADRLRDLGSFEYLLSIANLSILPDEVLAIPTVATINFHDGPLPKYAGLYCTSWALMNREPTHGVTWHYVERGVDEGRVLVQRLFDVGPDETALTLNTKCYSLGIESFGELLGHLSNDTLAPTEQDLEQRTYFARDQRPAAMATLDWSQPPEALVALVRGLDFGAYANPLCVAKVRADTVGLVGAASVAPAPADATPGAVLSVGDQSAVVACAGGAIELRSFRDADGRPSTPAALGLRAGEGLTSLDPDEADRLSETHASIVKHEGFWARRLALPALRLGVSADLASDPKTSLVARRDGASADELVAALCAALTRLTGMERYAVGYVDSALAALAEELDGWVAPVVPLSVDLRGELSAAEAASSIAERLHKTRARLTYPRDLPARTPSLGGLDAPSVVIAQLDASEGLAPIGSSATFYVTAGEVRVVHGADVEADVIGRLGAALVAFLEHPDASVHDLPWLTTEERALLLSDLERTATDYDAEATVHGLIEAQVERTPDRVALVFEGQELTYAELDARANQLAHRLRDRGVERGTIVGLHVERSMDMVVAMLGIQKAGGAYLPLDPEYPRERLVYMLEDSRAPVVVTDGVHGLLVEGVAVVDLSELGDAPTARLEVADPARGEDLAYVIYTSGSTGRPKGVMVEHRNVANFFVGMDERVSHEEPGVWLAVTSPSFDISVLELCWTLARGFTVLVHRDRRAAAGSVVSAEDAAKPMDFGFCYWGNDDAPGRDKYRLLFEGAKAADENGLHSVWTPERHFHAFGGPYANAAVSGAAVAAITRNVSVRSCSCVLPLHHPARVAEEWAMVDNMCDGRVGLAIAAGWQPDDFILRPENAPPESKKAMLRDIEVLRRLWRGEAVEFPKADGEMHAVVTQPRPVQKEVPIWLTIALNPKSFVTAAEIDANVLTHLLGQSIEELAEKITLYRNRRAELGLDPAAGKVTLMLHTFVDADREVAREVTRAPLKSYLASAASLIKQYVWMFPALKQPHNADAAANIDLESVSPEDMDAVLEFAFARYFEDSGLLGSVEDCVKRVDQLKAIGVDEIGCLIDFGVDTDTMLDSFPALFEVVRQTARPKPVAEARTFEQLVAERSATHMQCTPSMARMLLMDEGARAGLERLDHVMIGGEALPPSVASGVREASSATLTNMYGPTETTIWSSTDRVDDPDDVTIGTAIANTSLYLLDARRRLVPPGATGELWIGGDGVTRGYLFREELTAARFVPDPFRGDGARMYHTGDLARRREDGKLEFLGRVDHQVKFRGYRIELGEIESLLEQHEAVTGAVVVARDTGVGESQLVGYVTGAAGLDTKAVKVSLSARLPGYMIPGQLVRLDRFPLTPNGKIDRNALPDPAAAAAPVTTEAAPQSDVEQTIAAVWQKVLGVPRVGRSENFFDLGGHSLLAVRLHRELSEVIDAPLSMTDVFRFPTVASLAGHLGDDGDSGADLDKAASRASARRKAGRGGRSKRTLGRRS